MTLSQKLKKLRNEKNITQMELAEELDVTVSTIRNYEMESNPRKPTIKIYTKLAQFFNVPIEYLMYDDIENTTEENININELLGLSDEAIKSIKNVSIKDSDYKEVLNNFLTTVELDKLIEEIKGYINLNKVMRIMENYEFDGTKLTDTRELKRFSDMLENMCIECSKPVNITMMNQIRCMIMDLSNETKKILKNDKKAIANISKLYMRNVFSYN